MQTDFIRVILWATLLGVAFMLWNAWGTDYPTKSAAQLNATIHPFNNVNAPGVASAPLPVIPKPSGKFIHVRTDVLDVLIDAVSGNLASVKLPKYLQKQDGKETVSLLNSNPLTLYLAESNLVTPGGGRMPLNYQSQQTSHQLDSQNEIVVTLQSKNPGQLAVEKTFRFKRGSYLMDIGYQIVNLAPQPFSAQIDEKLIRKKIAPPNKGFFHINPFIGAAYSTPNYPFEKLSFEDMEKSDLNQTVKSGWVAMLQLYFLSAWIPDKTESFRFYTQDLGSEIYAIGMQNRPFTLAPQEQHKAHVSLYVGPAMPDVLNSIAPHLGLTVNYGWLWFISEWLFWFLQKIYFVVGNWGWSIVILTALIKLVFYHLSAKSYRSMAKMRLLQPRLEALKKQYGEDRQKLMQESMALYKKEGVNPMGGCLPIIVQIPVFIALYWVLLESVDLYQAPFILWIRDLSAPDPYYILPILMGLTMFVQQKLSPPPADPTQEKIMLFLPVLFTGLFLYFPSGLVLYWIVNNVLSILQQWYITRNYKPEKKSFKSKR